MAVNPHWIWTNDVDGKPDTMLTFSIVAFTVVILKVIFGGMTFVIGKQTIEVESIDPSTIMALLTPTLGAYVARKYTDKKFPDADGDGIPDDEDPTPYGKKKEESEQ